MPVKSGQRLIEQQQTWRAEKRSSQCDAVLLSPREPHDISIEQIGDPEQTRDLLELELSFASRGGREPVPEVTSNGIVRQEAGILKDHSDASLVRGHVDAALVIEEHAVSTYDASLIRLC